ncbi:hypothetical protein LTR24_006618 [Lithohypha guttulata]|uniref:Alpha/beta hydrolase fold-3 domain-containing protein n=1 Tax=Lithohypha guttulata TaxID=1690604 RepID=A0ABR0K5K6_9EURO|nr:hypothetical protein LTR24_006618 [Lithohypha guttulata]
MAGGSNPLPVGQVQDYSIRRQSTTGPDVLVRAFTPDGPPPSPAGWPAVLYFHGGGFVFGNINTENTVCTHMCMRAQCVVITADYRLAPEDPFPAGVEDCWETLLWSTSEGARTLGLDLRKVAIGGASSGANLAAVVTQRASTRQVPRFGGFVHQLLVVPVTDNTATTENNPSWREYQYTASLTAEKMTWYRKHYLPNKDDWPNPEASPLLFPSLTS